MPVGRTGGCCGPVLRWGSAVAVFVAVGCGTAYGITGLDRADVPGLGTHTDGRWAYPVLVKPPLPSGSPGPNDDARNPAGTHYADLRALVLPAPKGARADASLNGTDDWLATETFLKEFSLAPDREDVAQRLTDNGLRHIAARGWTTDDGTHTRVYLLQFDTGAATRSRRTTHSRRRPRCRTCRRSWSARPSRTAPSRSARPISPPGTPSP
ncbi:hypothetical protein AB0E08_06120 [Streptomyces sp. NPDC048281]|uniref:hypothetical protein n=1 Tax=Streptomyces sp. NPDC048281 TaxID=3154715 RepID=UPI00343A7650